MKKKQIMALAGFLVLMLVFTILSRAADTMSIPRVDTVRSEKRVIGHEVSASGKVMQNREQAVSTEMNQIVKSIHVNEGQQVEEGDLLFELDMQILEEQILLAQEDLKMQKLKNQDSSSSQSAEAQNRAASQNQANQDYNDAVNDANETVARAKAAWDQAQEQVDNFDSGGSPAGGPDEVEDTLKKTAKEKKKAYEKAARAVADLEQEIEDQIAAAGRESESESETENESGSVPAPAPAPVPTEAEIRASYKSQLDAAEKEETRTEKELETANQALETYQQNQAAQQGAAAESTKEQLIEAAEQAKAAYEEAVRQSEQGIRAAEKGINEANRAEASNSTAEVEQIEIDQKERTLQKLERLKENKGKVLAPVKGIITKVNITVGDRTPDGTSIRMADLSSGSKFTAQITKDQEKLLARNDEVILKSDQGDDEIQGLKIETITPDEENPEMYNVTVQLPENQLEMGTAATMKVQKKSQQYSTCVPLSALNQDNNQYYVLVLDTDQSVLGEETIARRIDVTIVEKNDEYAALNDGVIAADQDIITGSDRSLEADSRVRRQEQ